MAKEYRCPACQHDVDPAAKICSNTACRVELAFCSACRDVTTYALVEAREGRFTRDQYRCARCENVGVKCMSWVVGGYCNGLARVGRRFDHPLCARCTGHAGEVSRSIFGWSVIGAVGSWIRPRR